MRFVSAEEIDKFVSPRDLVEALRQGFAARLRCAAISTWNAALKTMQHS